MSWLRFAVESSYRMEKTSKGQGRMRRTSDKNITGFMAVKVMNSDASRVLTLAAEEGCVSEVSTKQFAQLKIVTASFNSVLYSPSYFTATLMFSQPRPFHPSGHSRCDRLKTNLSTNLSKLIL